MYIIRCFHLFKQFYLYQLQLHLYSLPASVASYWRKKNQIPWGLLLTSANRRAIERLGLNGVLQINLFQPPATVTDVPH